MSLHTLLCASLTSFVSVGCGDGGKTGDAWGRFFGLHASPGVGDDGDDEFEVCRFIFGAVLSDSVSMGCGNGSKSGDDDLSFCGKSSSPGPVRGSDGGGGQGLRIFSS